MLLAMGFTGKKAIALKLEYIKAFNKMEEQIKLLTYQKEYGRIEEREQKFFSLQKEIADTLCTVADNTSYVKHINYSIAQLHEIVKPFLQKFSEKSTKRGNFMQSGKISLAELKSSCKIWVNWKYQEVNGRMTKVPINSHTGYGAKSDNPDTWSYYEEAVKQQTVLSADGVGLMFGKIDEEYAVCGIDIDAHHQDKNNNAQEVIQLFSGTYVETSPSGNGYHVLFLAKTNEVPTIQQQGKIKLDTAYYCKNPHNELECYIAGLTNRYFTFTGNKVSETDSLADKTEELLIFLEKYMKKENFKKPASPQEGGFSEELPDIQQQFPSDWLEIARKAKNGDKFSALYDNGDISLYNHDESSADMALCSMLAFYLQGDSTAIDEAFRASALYRKKWERADYRQNTIQKAIDACNGTYYTPKSRTSSAKKTRKKIDLSESIEFNGRKQTIAQVRNYIENHPFLTGDEKNCCIDIVRLYDFYISQRYFLFAFTERSDSVRRFAYQNGVYQPVTDEMIKGNIQEFIFQNGGKEFYRPRIANEVFTMLTWTSQFLVPEEALNADENIINFRNGILHLDTMQLFPHSPQILSTIQLSCSWNGEQPAPVFDNFMYTFTSGNQEKAQLLLEFIGGCLSNADGSRFKKALIVWGEGDSGKSVLRNLVTKLLGENNQSGGSLARLEDRFGSIELYQRRIYGSPDLGYINVAQTTIFKNITGGDVIPIEQKNQPAFQYKYKGFVWFGCNKLPKFPPDPATYNRFIIVKCNNVIPKEKQDLKLLDKLLAESSGILYKVIIAFRQVLARKHFTEPVESNEIMKQYKVDNSIYIQFFNECCLMRTLSNQTYDVKDGCKVADIHKALKNWCGINFPSMKVSKAHFIEELTNENIDCQILKRNNGNRYYPFTLTKQAKFELGIFCDTADSNCHDNYTPDYEYSGYSNNY